MLKLTFIADTHYYSKSLGTEGKQYELRSGSDQKCLAESENIIAAAFEKIAKSDTDYVLIAGDLTNNGEKSSHVEFEQMLRKLNEEKKVYLITSTHDWCSDKNPRKFIGDTVTRDVKTVGVHYLNKLYSPYNYEKVKRRDQFRTHVELFSYVVQLSDNVRLLALADDKNMNNHAGFSEEHLRWIEYQIQKAKEDNCLIIGMMHHLLVPHISPLITGSATIENREYIASRLADAGLKYMFVGHSHIQNTTEYKSPNGNVLKEVNIGSLVGYPAPMVNVTIHDDMTLSYQIEYLDSFTYNGQTIPAQEFLAEHALALIHRILECENKEEFEERMTALQADGKQLAKYFFAIKPLLKFGRECTVKQVYGKLKILGVSRLVDKGIFEKFGNLKFMDIVDGLVLSAMDGGKAVYERNSDYYRLVMSFVSIPSKIFKKNNDMKKIIFAFDAILTGGKYNNQQDTI